MRDNLNTSISHSLEEIYTHKDGGRYTIDGKVFVGLENSVLSYIIHLGTQIIAEKAFLRDEQLRRVVIPDGVTTIGNHAFNGCENLREVLIPESVTSIGDMAFASCHKLERVLLPNGIKRLGTGTFSSCYSLRDINLPESLEAMGKSVFSDSQSLSKISLPPNLREFDGNPFDGHLIVDTSRNPYFDVFEDILYTNNMKDVVACLSCKTKVTLSQSVETIRSRAFGDCDCLQSIQLPKGLHTIDDAAFIGCKRLLSLELPSTLQTIGNNPFALSGLQHLKLYTLAFRVVDNILYTADMKRLIASFSSDEEVVIPEGVKNIGSTAFAFKKYLKTIYLPKTIESLDEFAILKCPHLQMIYSHQKEIKMERLSIFACPSFAGIKFL